MKKKTVWYVMFDAPGLIVGEAWSGPEQETPIAPEEVEWPEDAYAFRIYKRTDVIDGKTVYRGTPQAVPNKRFYHPDSVVQSLEEVARRTTDTGILRHNMEANRWSHVVWTRWDNWPQPWDPKTMKILKKAGG